MSNSIEFFLSERIHTPIRHTCKKLEYYKMYLHPTWVLEIFIGFILKSILYACSVGRLKNESTHIFKVYICILYVSFFFLEEDTYTHLPLDPSDAY